MKKNNLGIIYLLMELVSSLFLDIFIIINGIFIFNPNRNIIPTIAIVALIGAVACCFERAIECYKNQKENSTKFRLIFFILSLLLTCIILFM